MKGYSIVDPRATDNQEMLGPDHVEASSNRHREDEISKRTKEIDSEIMILHWSYATRILQKLNSSRKYEEKSSPDTI